jgi:hypothetical protein
MSLATLQGVGRGETTAAERACQRDGWYPDRIVRSCRGDRGLSDRCAEVRMAPNTRTRLAGKPAAATGLFLRFVIGGVL